jgi:hypothetical protein
MRRKNSAVLRKSLHISFACKDLLNQTQSFAFILIGLQYNGKHRSGMALASNSGSLAFVVH